jgi:hypothetical protein
MNEIVPVPKYEAVKSYEKVEIKLHVFLTPEQGGGGGGRRFVSYILQSPKNPAVSAGLESVCVCTADPTCMRWLIEEKLAFSGNRTSVILLEAWKFTDWNVPWD